MKYTCSANAFLTYIYIFPLNICGIGIILFLNLNLLALLSSGIQIKKIMKRFSIIIIILFFVGCLSSQNKTSSTLPANEEKAKEAYAEYCSGCHGEQMEAFVDRNWKHGKDLNSIIRSIKYGSPDFGMPAYDSVISDEVTATMADMLVKYIKEVDAYNPAPRPTSNIFVFDGIRVRLDTIATELNSPWGFAQLPDGNYLITDRAGQLYQVDHNRNKMLIKNTPAALSEGQGGLLDLKLHPNFSENGWVYISYSKYRMDGNVKMTTTAIVRGKIKNGEFTDAQEIFEANPYTSTKHHYGSKIMFDDKGYIFFSVGERGRENEFPQSTQNDNGKIHRLHDDGRIPEDNPFVQDGKSKGSIWSYGHRNPQGLIFDKGTGIIWETEHGPRGGDELNIIRKGANYGWPVICYCINYDGKPITSISKKEGMEQPEIYWTPSIAPCGMTMITGDRYPQWKGNIMVGSLRYKYLNRCEMKGNKVVKQEKLFSNLGRMRNAEMGNDGYLYIAVESPGRVFKVVPVE